MKNSNTKFYNATKPQDWLLCPDVSQLLKDQIKSLSQLELKRVFSADQLAFGTAGIRGIIGPGTQRLNPFVYHQMAYGYGKYLLSKSKHPSCVIGHDNRLFSDTFASECATILSLMGIEVYLYSDNKLISTPIISYTIRDLKLTGAINVTASHNPKEYNGFKAYNASGSQILPEEAKIIIDNMPNSSDILNIKTKLFNSKSSGKPITYLDYDKIVDEYFQKVINQTFINKQMFESNIDIKNEPIVFTGFQGTTTELMPKFLKKIGMKNIIEVPGQNIISPNFESSPIANPEDDRAFDKAKEIAKEYNAKIIFGCDPDGDRMTIGFLKEDGSWRFLNGNEQGILFTWYKLKSKKWNKKPFIISSLVSTTYIDKIAKKYKAKVLRTPTGFKWMCNLIDKELQNGDFVIAFEEAIGALVHPVCRDKDSYGSIALMLEIMQMEHDKDLHHLLEETVYSQFGGTFGKTYSFVIDSNNWKEDAQKVIKRALSEIVGGQYDYYQTKKVHYNKKASAVVWDLNYNSWIKFRVSGTEPKVKIYLCLNGQPLKQVNKSAQKIIKSLKDEILKGIKLK